MTTPMLDRFYEFLDRPLKLWSRGVLLVLVVPLVLAFTQPLWRISMEAPQYPKGLWLEIYAHKVEAGNHGQHIDEINTLNHYIGMHRIDRAALTDLDWIPFALGALVLLTLRCAAIGNVRALLDLLVLSGYIAGFAGARFVYRMWVFGHQLDPKAPVTVEPFMPALFGTKQIANFTTHSFPQLGTVLVGVFLGGLTLVAAWHLFTGRRSALRSMQGASAGSRKLEAGSQVP